MKITINIYEHAPGSYEPGYSVQEYWDRMPADNGVWRLSAEQAQAEVCRRLAETPQALVISYCGDPLGTGWGPPGRPWKRGYPVLIGGAL